MHNFSPERFFIPPATAGFSLAGGFTLFWVTGLGVCSPAIAQSIPPSFQPPVEHDQTSIEAEAEVVLSFDPSHPQANHAAAVTQQQPATLLPAPNLSGQDFTQRVSLPLVSMNQGALPEIEATIPSTGTIPDGEKPPEAAAVPIWQPEALKSSNKETFAPPAQAVAQVAPLPPLPAAHPPNNSTATVGREIVITNPASSLAAPTYGQAPVGFPYHPQGMSGGYGQAPVGSPYHPQGMSGGYGQAPVGSPYHPQGAPLPPLPSPSTYPGNGSLGIGSDGRSPYGTPSIGNWGQDCIMGVCSGAASSQLSVPRQVPPVGQPQPLPPPPVNAPSFYPGGGYPGGHGALPPIQPQVQYVQPGQYAQPGAYPQAISDSQSAPYPQPVQYLQIGQAPPPGQYYPSFQTSPSGPYYQPGQPYPSQYQQPVPPGQSGQYYTPGQFYAQPGQPYPSGQVPSPGAYPQMTQTSPSGQFVPLPQAPGQPMQEPQPIPVERPLTRSAALTPPSLKLQGVATYQGDDFSARARVTGFYYLSPRALVGATVDFTEGNAFSDSPEQGFSINELYFATSLAAIPNLRFVVGQIDLTSYFDRNSFAKDGATHFFNPVFQTNPALAATGIGSRPGALVNWSVTDNIEAKAAIFSSSRSLNDFSLDGFAGELGVRYGNLIVRATYASGRDSGARSGFREIFQLDRGDGRTGLLRGDREESYGINGELFIPEIKMGVFARYGQYTNQTIGESGTTFNLGVSFLDVFSPNDRAGIAYGRNLSNAGLRRQAGDRNPDVFEVFYDFAFLPNLRLGFSYQALNQFSESIFGVRVKTEFDLLQPRR